MGRARGNDHPTPGQHGSLAISGSLLWQGYPGVKGQNLLDRRENCGRPAHPPGAILAPSHGTVARPGRANQADSPVSQSETCAPEATAIAATVNACEHRSGASAPAVTLTTSFFAMGRA